MQFNVAIMNPPYSGNLHLKILEQVIPVAERTVCLHPAHWDEIVFETEKDVELKIKLSNLLKDKEIINGNYASKLFGISWGDLYVSFFDGKTSIKEPCKKRTLIMKMQKRGITLDNLYIPHSIKPGNFAIPVATLYMETNFKRCSPVMSNTGKYAKHGWSIGFDKWQYVNFNTKEEATNFENMWNNTFMGKFASAVLGGLSRQIRHFPIPDDYTQPWTDERLYKYFKLTPEEIKIIEDACN